MSRRVRMWKIERGCLQTIDVQEWPSKAMLPSVTKK